MSNLRHRFVVAGLPFSIEGLDTVMPNLLPFESDEPSAEDIFSLKITDSLPECSFSPIYTTDDGPGFPEIAIAESPLSYEFRMKPGPDAPLAGILHCTKDFTRALLKITASNADFDMNNSLMLLFAFASAKYKALEMHSSVVMNSGKGFLFLGKSGTGKSTHSKLWLNHIPGTELLNDDNPILRVMPDGQVRVFGSPWSGKTPCYKNKDVPAGAIVRIRQAPFNKIEALKGIHAYASLMTSASAFRPFKGLSDLWHESISEIITKVPCFILDCLPNEDAAQLCHSRVNG